MSPRRRASRALTCLGWLSLALAGPLAWPSPAAAQPAIELPEATLITVDGRSFTGELVSRSADEAVLRIAGIDTPFQTADIASLDVAKTVSVEYAERKAALDADDPEAWYQLAYFLFDRGRYDDAKSEVADLLARHPGDEPATRLDAAIDARVLLQRQRPESPAPTPTRPTRAADRPAFAATVDVEPAPTQEAAYWLSDDDINRLRVWELPEDLASSQPRVVVPRDVLDEVYANYAADPAVPRGREARNRFRAEPGWRQLQLIFQLRARDLYARVRVAQDPPALRAYRGLLNPAYVVGYFRRYFGTGQVPGLYLLRYRPNAAPSALANFASLANASSDGEPLINRSTPSRSLLLQWGLPRADAELPAPDVEGWRPFFTGTDDPRFQQYADWIGSLYSPTPDYDLDYSPPSLGDVLGVDPESVNRP